MNSQLTFGRVRRVGAAALLASLAAAAACSAESGTSPGGGGTPSIRTLRLTPASSELGVGGTLQLELVALDANDNEVAEPAAVWASADTTIAVVSPSGVVTGRKLGVVQVQAAAAGQSAFSVVSVVAARVAAVTVGPQAPSVAVGATVQLTATVADGAGARLADRLVFWQSSNDAVARVTSTGLVSAVAAGTATITATSEGRSASTTVTVAAPAPAAPTTARVDVSPGSATLAVGATQQLTATPRDAAGNARTGRTVSWTSSDASVATVSGSGVVTAVRAGSATITGTADGVGGTAAITVTAPPPATPGTPTTPPSTPSTPSTPAPEPVARVIVTPALLAIEEDERRTLTALLSDASGRVLTGRSCTWSGGTANVGKNNGRRIVDIEPLTGTTARVTGRAEGATAVTATCEGRTASVSIIVDD